MAHSTLTPRTASVYRLVGSGLLWGAASLALLMAITAHAQRVPPVERPPMPRLQLPVNTAQGEQAIRLLGDRLPEVARAHGMQAEELRQQLLSDTSLRIDRKGRLLYIERPLPEKPKAGTGSTTPAPSGTIGAAYTLEDALALNSRPSAKRTLYLDFTGHTATGTAWNSSYASYGNYANEIISPAFDLDGNPAEFNDIEKSAILDIWRRVAEDFAPFDLNVTTQEPLPEALLRSSTSDDVYGSRVVVTKDFTTVTTYPCTCGGFAYLSVFDMAPNTQYQPAYVFHNQLSNRAKNIAEAVSHEAGHNLGLRHDGTSTVGYYRGHGSGETGWAPIMGVGYDRNLVQWSKGEYPLANQKQNDLLVIQEFGVPLRADDHGDLGTMATNMTVEPVLSGSTVTGQRLTASGVIETASDVDVFSFNVQNGASVGFTLSGALPSPNLDAQLKLVNVATNQTVATINPVSELGASLRVDNLAAGAYYLLVEGVGKGDLATGYSDYGSLGQYQIAGTAPPPLGQAPVVGLQASEVQGYAKELTVTFSVSATDADSGIASLTLAPGDGQTAAVSPSMAGFSPTFTYNSAGTFTALARATDTQGLTGQASTSITAFTPRMDVGSFRVYLTTARKQTLAATDVLVLNALRQPVAGATVFGNWGGSVTGSVSATTNASGVATFRSTALKSRNVASFTVTHISGAGYAYDANLNLSVPVSGSVAAP